MARRRLADASARVSRTAILIVGGFLLGFAISALFTTAQSARTAPRVADADYALMVADLFEHEKSVFNARERLLVVSKNPLDFAEAALEQTKKEKPDAQRDLVALQQLSQALRQAEEVPNPRASGPGVLVLVGLIVASVALAAGAAWVWKLFETRGMRVSPRVGAPAGTAARLDAMPLLEMTRARLAGAFSGLGRRPSATPDEPAAFESEPLPPRRSRAPRPRPTAPIESRVPAAESTAGPRQSFEVRYELGDEDFDEVHPIHDADGELVGACGVSATEPTGDRPGRCYGFTVWMQSYANRGDLSALGIVTRGGHLARSAAIAEWERRGTIEQAVTVERGQQLELRTTAARARVTIVDFDYAAPSPGSPGYFGRLVVRFDVEPRR